MIKIRISGDPAEVEQAAAAVRAALWVLQDSSDKPAHGGGWVYRYIDAEYTGEVYAPPLNPKSAPAERNGK